MTFRHLTPPLERNPSAETTRDVVLGLAFGRLGEHGLGVVDLDELTGLPHAFEAEERGLIAYARGLLHACGVTMTIV